MKYFICILLFHFTLTSRVFLRNFNNTSQFPYTSNGRNIVMSGNISSNQLTGNKNTSIQNHRYHTINSNNTDHSTVINRNSYNKISTIKKSGNISKEINHGEISIGNGMALDGKHNSTMFRRRLKEIMHNSLYNDAMNNYINGNNIKNIENFHRNMKNN